MVLIGMAVVTALGIQLFVFRHSATKSGSAPAVELPKTLNPIVSLSINVPRLIDLMEKQIKNKENEAGRFAKLALFQGQNLKKIELTVFPDAEHGVLATLAFRGGRQMFVKRMLDDEGFLGGYVENVGEGLYRFKTQAFADGGWGNFPADLYALRLIGDDCIMAPQHYFAQLPDGFDLIGHAPVVRFADAFKHNDNVAVLAIRFPRKFSIGWEQKLVGHDLFKQAPRTEMFIGRGMMLVQQLAEPFKQLEYIALGLRVDEGHQRTLSYAQQFWPEINGAAIYQKLQNKNTDLSTGVLDHMVRLLADPRFETGARFNANRLTINMSWQPEDDTAVIAALSEATTGQLITRRITSSGKPTPGPVKTVYTESPRLVLKLNGKHLKRDLPDYINRALFPGQFWDTGVDPHMALELDPVSIPNAVLAKVDYEILDILTPDGRSIIRSGDPQFKAPLNLNGRFANTIRLDVSPGKRASDLGTARLRFKVKIPTVITLFDFKADAAQQPPKHTGRTEVVAERIEKDIAQVSTQGGGDFWLFAYDATGQAISPKESLGFSNHKFVRFSGVIDKLQVVVAEKTLDHTFDIDVQLNGGRKLELSHKPEVPSRVRLDLSPVSKYAVFTTEEIANLKVTWIEGSEVWSKGLSVKLPNGPFSGEAQWEAYFFGANKVQVVDGTPMWSGDDISYAVEHEQLKKCHAAFGKVRLKVAAKIETLQFIRTPSKGFISRRISTGQKIEAAFNQNEITYKPGKAKILQIRAFNAGNRRLKMDNFTNSGRDFQIRYFWGVPERLEVEVATQHIERLITFDLRPRPVDLKAYNAYQQEVAQRRIAIKTHK